MNNIKKFTSLIISVLLIFTQVAVPEFSAQADTTDTNDKEVYNSHSTSTTKAQLLDTATSKYALLSTEAVESNDKSLKLTGTGAVGCASRDWILHSDQSSEDWSSYNYLNFRIKNASTNDDGSAKNGLFGFRMFSKAGGYWWKNDLHAITNTEWHTFTVKIPDDLVHSKNSATSMNDIYALKLNYISGTMYLEKIWLSTENPNGTGGDDNSTSSGGDDNSTSSGGDNTGGDNTSGDDTSGDDTSGSTSELFNSNSTSSTKERFSNNYAILTNEAVESNDKSLKLTGTGVNESESKNPTFAKQDWTAYNYINFRIKNSSATEPGMFYFYATVTGGTASTTVGYWSTDTVKVEGTSWQTVSLAIPGEFNFKYASTPAKYEVMEHIEGLRFDYIKGTMYLEKIWLSETKPEETYLTASSVPDGYDDVKVDSASFTFTYSQDLAPVGKQNADISFTTGGGDVAFDASYSENKLTIVPRNPLDYNTSYSISVSGVKDHNGFGIPDETVLNFTTMERAVMVSDITIRDGGDTPLTDMPSNGVISASATASNLTADSAAATLVLACYDSNGKMLMNETSMMSVSLAPSEEKPITASISSSDYSGKTVCAFVIDTITSRNLLTPDFVCLPVTSSGEDSSVLPGSANELSLMSFGFTNDIASLIASLNGGMKRTLLMSILSDGSPIHMSPLCSSSDGNVIANYKMTNSDASGDYTLELKGRKVKNSLTKNFTHLDEHDKATFLAAANSLSSVDVGVAFLRSYSGVFELDASLAGNNTLMHMTAEALLHNKPYANFEAVKSFVKEAVVVCGNLNSQTWDTLASYVINNESILIGKNNISDFKALSETNRNKVCNSINPLTFSNLNDLYQKLSAATQSYKNGLNSNPTPAAPAPSTVTGNYSVSSPSVSAPQPSVPVVTPSTDFSFNDLGDYSWAADSIQNLLDKGIISKSDDNKYRPADMITRSEFVKLLVCGFYDINEQVSSEFTDVNGDDWCYTYISIAAKYGLVNGREDGSFGKNDYITRQEMAAVIYRAVLDKNINLNSSQSEYTYTDHADIADYAKDAVYALYHAGIMSGMGDGNFASTENANRAQAACVIDRILKGANK